MKLNERKIKKSILAEGLVTSMSNVSQTTQSIMLDNTPATTLKIKTSVSELQDLQKLPNSTIENGIVSTEEAELLKITSLAPTHLNEI